MRAGFCNAYEPLAFAGFLPTLPIMSLQVTHLEKSLHTLAVALERLREAPPQSDNYDVFRNAVVKGFELSLETSGKLLRRALKAYEGDPKTIDSLVFKDIIRHGAKHSLIEAGAVERWFAYRDNRNSTAHDYGAAFAEHTLRLLDDFVRDAKALSAALQSAHYA